MSEVCLVGAEKQEAEDLYRGIMRGEIFLDQLMQGDPIHDMVFAKVTAEWSLTPPDMILDDVDEVPLGGDEQDVEFDSNPKKGPPVTPYYKLLKIVREREAERNALLPAFREQAKAKGLSDTEALRLFNEKYPLITAKELRIKWGNILSGSGKLDKNQNVGWFTPGLYLAPSVLSGLGNLCGFASIGCAEKACLAASGHADIGGKFGPKGFKERILKSEVEEEKIVAELMAQGIERDAAVSAAEAKLRVSDTMELRFRRTLLYFKNRPQFTALLEQSILKYKAKAEKAGIKYGVRLNCVSDVDWLGTIQKFPDIQFYDYTKDPYRMMRFLNTKVLEAYYDPNTYPSNYPPMFQDAWPSNYYLIFSMSEVNFAWCLIFMRLGACLSVVFNLRGVKSDSLPTHFIGQEVINADLFDCRFLDPLIWTQQGLPERESLAAMLAQDKEPKLEQDALSTKAQGPYICGLTIKGGKQKRERGEIDFFVDVQGLLGASSGKMKKKKNPPHASFSYQGDPSATVEYMSQMLHNNLKQIADNPDRYNASKWLPSPQLFAEHVPELAEIYSQMFNSFFKR